MFVECPKSTLFPAKRTSEEEFKAGCVSKNLLWRADGTMSKSSHPCHAGIVQIPDEMLHNGITVEGPDKTHAALPRIFFFFCI